MTKIYDEKYSTKVAFNAPIMKSMLEKRDISLVSHWLENGEPNKKLALEAIHKIILMEWVEALELFWANTWLTKKSIINKAWQIITAPYGASYNQPLKNTSTEHWLVNKTYNENVLSKNEINQLHLSLLSNMTTSRNDYYWDMFFTPDLNLKGKTSNDIFWSLNYFSNHEYYNLNGQKDIDFEKLSKGRLQKFIANKNGIEIEPLTIFSILAQIKDQYLFWQIINSNLKMNKTDLFLLSTLTSLYFKGIGKIIHKMTDSEIDEKLDILMKQFVKFGLTETVTFNVKDLLENYAQVFNSGYISLSNVRMLDYLLNSETSATYLPKVQSGFYNKDKLVDVTFSTGEAFFFKPVVEKFDKLVYNKMTEKDKIYCNNKFKTYIK